MSGLDGFGWGVIATAVAVAVVHTLLGPDHYLPFIMIGRARRWSAARTIVITAVCGVGHVASSVFLGLAGLAFGWTIGRIQAAEGLRGNLSAWILVAFGTAYAAWGARHAYRRSRGIVTHAHHEHVHVHAHGDHDHGHAHDMPGKSVTFWTLFAVFVLGPCEPLVPLFILPASRGLWGLAAATALIFGIVTIACMALLTGAGLAGFQRLPLGPLERWSHALAGAVIALSGLSVVALGL